MVQLFISFFHKCYIGWYHPLHPIAPNQCSWFSWLAWKILSKSCMDKALFLKSRTISGLFCFQYIFGLSNGMKMFHSGLAHSQNSFFTLHFSLFILHFSFFLRCPQVAHDDFHLFTGEQSLLRTVVGFGQVLHKMRTATHPVGETIQCWPHFEVGSVEHGQLSFAHGSRTHIWQVFFHNVKIQKTFEICKYAVL